MVTQTIATAIAGEYGGVAIDYRFEWRTRANGFIATITNAFLPSDGCTIHLDNDQAVSRTADFHLRADFLPPGFVASVVSDKAIAVFADVVTPAQTFSRQLGLFHLDEPQQDQNPNGYEEWTAKGSDVTIVLANQTVVKTYALDIGTNYLDQVRQICQSFGLTVGSWFSSTVLPAAIAWAPGTSYLTIVNDLLFGLNYYDIWADEMGVLQTRPRIDPSTEAAAVVYSTIAEPRMLTTTTQRTVNTSQYKNYCTLSLDDPARPQFATFFTNADPSCPLSTVASGKTDLLQFSGGGTPSTKAVLDHATGNAIAVFELQLEATYATQRVIHTMPDPRRTNHEWYTLDIDLYEPGTLWRCAKWDLPCVPGGDMQHTLGLAAEVAISAGPPALTRVIQRLGAMGSASTTPLGSTWLTIPIGTGTTSGNGIVIVVLSDTNPSGWSVADTPGNVYSLLASTAVAFGTGNPTPVPGAGQFWIGVFGTISTHALTVGNTIQVSVGAGNYYTAGAAWEVVALNPPITVDTTIASNEATDPYGVNTLTDPYTPQTGLTVSTTDLIIGVLGVVWNATTFNNNVPPAGLTFTVGAGQGWNPALETVVPTLARNNLYPVLICELGTTVGTGRFIFAGTLNSPAAGWGALCVPIAGQHV